MLFVFNEVSSWWHFTCWATKFLVAECPTVMLCPHQETPWKARNFVKDRYRLRSPFLEDLFSCNPAVTTALHPRGCQGLAPQRYVGRYIGKSLRLQLKQSQNLPPTAPIMPEALDPAFKSLLMCVVLIKFHGTISKSTRLNSSLSLCCLLVLVCFDIQCVWITTQHFYFYFHKILEIHSYEICLWPHTDVSKKPNNKQITGQKSAYFCSHFQD